MLTEKSYTDIQRIVEIYFPKDKFPKEVRELVITACTNVERETRQRVVSSIYDLANTTNNSRPPYPEA